MKKYIFIAILLISSLCLFAGDWPAELDNEDIIFRVAEGVYAPRESWTTAAVLPMTTGLKDENIPWRMEYWFTDPGGDLASFDLYKNGVRLGYAGFGNADSTPSGGVPNATITPTGYAPDTDEFKALLAKYMNINYVVFNNPMGTNWPLCKYSATYYNSKLTLSVLGSSGSGPSGTKAITGTGIYVYGDGAPFYAIVEVLKYIDYSPKIVKTSGSYFNGTNSMVKFDDLIEKAFSGNAFTVTDVAPHSSVSVNTAGKFFYIALSDKPITEKAVAKYNFKVENGYAAVEAELSFTLYPTSLVINSATGGNTDPSPGFVGGVPGESISVTATPDDTHTFTKWIGSAVTADNETDNPITLTFADAQMTLTPVYAEVPYVERFNLAVSFSPTRGKIKVGDTTYDTSSTIRLEKGVFAEITAIPATGYEFSVWSGDISVALAEDSFVQIYMEKDINLAAIFKQKETTAATTSTSGTLGSTATSAPTTVTYDTSALTSLISSLNSSSKSSGTTTGASSFKEASPFGYGSSKSSSSSKGSYGTGKSGSSLTSSGSEGNIRDISELKKVNGYYFKYKAYENYDSANGGADTYYSNDEVEAVRNSYAPASGVLTKIYNLLSGGD